MKSKKNETTGNVPSSPLADRVRPKSLTEFYGQEHLVGEGKPIRLMIENKNISPFILWGPPGTGKTTLAQIIAEETDSKFYQISAVSAGVKEVRNVIQIAEHNKSLGLRTILFIDEIHRFNKAQQDALLHSVEKGLIILIGATTENPSFEVIPALRSRARVYVLNELSKNDLHKILHNAISKDEFISGFDVDVPDEDYLLYLSGGDARIMLSIFESAIFQESEKEKILITKELLDNIIQRKNIFYDKGGEEHYNIISAFIKSVRGSDPDAALYWLARMLEGGEDPLFIARRLIVLASEDIGNASPNGLVLAEAAFGAVEKIGMPEARIVLAQCTTYLASSPKSNASYMGISKAEQEVKTQQMYSVPNHLRNAPTKLMEELGYGEKYKYPHDFDNNFLIEKYFPEELEGKQFYFPTENGQEKNLKERLKFLWKNKKNIKKFLSSLMNKCIACGELANYKEYVVREMMFGTKDQFTYLECSNCGCLQIKQVPSDLSKYYPKNYYSFKTTKLKSFKSYLISLRDKHSIGFNNLIGKMLAKYFPAPFYLKVFKVINAKRDWKILDIGSGTGEKLLALKRIGFKNLLGIDPNIPQDFKYSDGLRVLKMSISEVDDKFDLILFNHSLEHMEDPVSILKEAAKKITDQSLVVIRIPVAGCYAWQKYGTDWDGLDAPRHIFIPTKKSLKFLTEKSGFEIVKQFCDSTSMQFWASEQYQRGISLIDPKSYMMNPKKSIFSKKQVRKFREEAEKLNLEENGDIICLVLKKTNPIYIYHS